MKCEWFFSAFFIQNDDMSFETILPEVAVKGESVVEPVLIDQREAGAVDEAELFIVVADENRLGELFYGLGHAEYPNRRLIETSQKFDRGIMVNFETDESVGFGEDEVRC